MGCLLRLLLGAWCVETGTQWPARRSIDLGMGYLLRLLPVWLDAWLVIQLVSATFLKHPPCLVILVGLDLLSFLKCVQAIDKVAIGLSLLRWVAARNFPSPTAHTTRLYPVVWTATWPPYACCRGAGA